MTFGIDYKLRAIDLWWLTISNVYRSLAGVVNVIFTVSVIILTVTFWGKSILFVRIILILVCLFFPVIQPLLIYSKVSKQISQLPKDMVLNFDDEALHVVTPTDHKDYKWKDIKGITYTPHMVILNTSGREGFMLSYNLWKENKDELLNFLHQYSK